MSALSVAFKDRLCFEAHCDYLLNASHVPPQTPYLPRRDPEARGKINLDLSLLRTRLNGTCHCFNNAKGWRWVDFRPKYHTQLPKSPKMVFHGRETSAGLSGVGGVTTQREKARDRRFLTTPSGKVDDGRYAEALDYLFTHQVEGLSGYEGGGRGKPRVTQRPPFRRRFHCSKAEDDRVEGALDRREYVAYPYRDPKPFDHRGVRR